MSFRTSSQMRCPQCNLEMPFDRRVFSRDFLCEQCGTKLLVSEAYSRMLVAISIVIGFGLPWVAHLHELLIPALVPLAGFIAVLASDFASGFVNFFLVVG